MDRPNARESRSIELLKSSKKGRSDIRNYMNDFKKSFMESDEPGNAHNSVLESQLRSRALPDYSSNDSRIQSRLVSKADISLPDHSAKQRQRLLNQSQDQRKHSIIDSKTEEQDPDFEISRYGLLIRQKHLEAMSLQNYVPSQVMSFALW